LPPKGGLKSFSSRVNASYRSSTNAFFHRTIPYTRSAFGSIGISGSQSRRGAHLLVPGDSEPSRSISENARECPLEVLRKSCPRAVQIVRVRLGRQSVVLQGSIAVRRMETRPQHYFPHGPGRGTADGQMVLSRKSSRSRDVSPSTASSETRASTPLVDLLDEVRSRCSRR